MRKIAILRFFPLHNRNRHFFWKKIYEPAAIDVYNPNIKSKCGPAFYLEVIKFRIRALGCHGAGHGWCTAACCSRRLAFDLILLQQRIVNNRWYENSAQGFLSRKCERAAFCCWVLGMPLLLDKNFPSTFVNLHFGRLRRAIKGRRATCERAIF